MYVCVFVYIGWKCLILDMHDIMSYPLWRISRLSSVSAARSASDPLFSAWKRGDMCCSTQWQSILELKVLPKFHFG